MERSPKERHEILKYILDEYGLQFKKGVRRYGGRNSILIEGL